MPEDIESNREFIQVLQAWADGKDIKFNIKPEPRKVTIAYRPGTTDAWIVNGKEFYTAEDCKFIEVELPE